MKMSEKSQGIIIIKPKTSVCGNRVQWLNVMLFEISLEIFFFSF